MHREKVDRRAYLGKKKLAGKNRNKNQVEEHLWKDKAEKKQTTALEMCSAYQNKPGEMVLNFVTVLLRALLGHSAYPEPLVGEMFKRNGQPQLQAWKSSSVKVARQHPETRSQAEW